MRPNTSWLSQCAALALGLLITTPAFAAKITLRNASTNDIAVTMPGVPVAIDVLANDKPMRGKTILRVTQQPRHGQARVVDGEIVYTPKPGWEGDDRFNYSVLSLGKVGKARVDVTTAQPLVIQGQVVDAPVANAIVTASINGLTYTTTADGNGFYSLPIIAAPRDVVVLGARGTGAQAAVNFLSVLGQYDRLQQEAGDGTLDRDENNQVQVTHVSTAEAFLLQAAGDLGSDEAIQAARDALDVTKLLQMAAAIKLVVDEGFALPAGANDVLDMISDPALLDQFVADANTNSPGAMDAATQATIADPSITPAATAADYVGAYTLLNEIGAPGTIRVGLIQGERIELHDNGTGIYLGAALNADPSLTWTFQDNEVVAVFNNPEGFFSYPTIDGYGQIPELNVRTQMRLTRLVDGGGRDVFGVTYTTHYSYPDHAELEGGVSEYTMSLLAIEDGAGSIPYTIGDFPSLRTLPVVNVEHINSSGYEPFDFAIDGTGEREGGEFEWSIDPNDGSLWVVHGPNSFSRYTRLATDGRGGEGVIAMHILDGQLMAEWSISNVHDGSLAFSHDFLVGSWRGGFDISQASLDPSILGLYMVLGANGSSTMASWNASVPDTVYHTPQSWKYDADRDAMVSTVYYNDFGWTPECSPPEDGCYVNVRRTWHPVSQDGNRIYVSEELSWDEDWAPDYEMEIQHQRGNFYEREEPPFHVVLP